MVREEGETHEMNPPLTRGAVSGLRWVLCLVVLVQSVHFARAPGAGHQFAKTGVPQWLPSALGGSEVVAAILFLVPATRLIGSYALLVIFAIAAAVHLLHGQFDVGSLFVYGMSLIVCMGYEDKGVVDVPHDR